MINKIMRFLKPKTKELLVHEILGNDFENKIFEDKDGNRFKAIGADWSGFYCTCLNKDNTPIIETKVDPRTKEVYTSKSGKQIGYYSKGFKLTK